MKNKKILLCLTGSISIYKSTFLLRALVAAGADVSVVMTKSATRFMSPMIFSVFSGKNVEVDMFSENGEMAHINLAKEADLFLVAPGTGNIIGKAASGIADDLLSTILLGGLDKTIIVPAMDLDMWAGPATQRNVSLLEDFGVSFVGPDSGLLASGLEGGGRMVHFEKIIAAVLRFFMPEDVKKSFEGETVLVTAGPTREAIDPVRFLSNRSSGKMGYAMAQSALDRSAKVILISGPVHIEPPEGVELISVETASQMEKAVVDNFGRATIVSMVAAVADFTAKNVSKQKLKNKGLPAIELVPTTDILNLLGHSKARSEKILIGFAAETESLLKNAAGKLKSKNLDFIVLNDVSEHDRGFEVDTNSVTVVNRAMESTEIPLMPKYDIASKIYDIVQMNR